MDIIEKTRELGEMIQKSEEMKILKAAEEKQAGDEETVKLIQTYNMKCAEISNDVQQGRISQKEAMEINKKEYENVMKNENIANYVKAKNAFNDLIEKINGVLTFYITGEEPGGCSHECCDGCGGCH